MKTPGGRKRLLGVASDVVSLGVNAYQLSTLPRAGGQTGQSTGEYLPVVGRQLAPNGFGDWEAFPDSFDAEYYDVGRENVLNQWTERLPPDPSPSFSPSGFAADAIIRRLKRGCC